MHCVRSMLSIAVGWSLCVWPAGIGFAETVSVTKDCPAGGTCNVTGTTTPIGRFRTTTPSFNWEATYSGTPTQAHRFWVSQTGANMATIELTTNAGDIQGIANLPLGIYFISIQTFSMGPGGYSVFGPGVHGDPHITTTNGIHYDFQGAGEFVMLKHLEKYEVQTRMTPVATTGPAPPNPHTGLPTCVSINTAAAVRASKQRITYQPNANGRPDPTGLQLRVDGALVVGRVDGKTLDDGTKIWKDSRTGELRIQHPDYTGVRISPHWWASQGLWYLDVDMTPPPASAGIAGDVPGDGWLPALADGSSMGPKPADLQDRYKALYVKFADSWRVDDSSTLFDYSPGTSTKTYTMRAWPGEVAQCELPFTVPVKGVNIDVAEQACKGIQSARLKRFCVFDVMITGNTGFGRSYAVALGLPKARGTTRNPR
jgi:hypothetical protein